MKKPNKNLKTRYRAKLLQAFNRLKLEGLMVEVLEYTRFIREEEKELQKLSRLHKHSSCDLEGPYLPVDNSTKVGGSD